MRRNSILAGIFIALMLAMPLAQAEWRGRGWVEPDTRFDQVDGYMHLDPDVSPVQSARKVYFNVVAYSDEQSVNPNSAVLGSAIMAYPTRVHAWLGVWKDCNQDGYVGHPEGVLQWYPSAALVDTKVCPPQAAPDYLKPGQGVVFNDGTWVREFFMIGPDAFGEPTPQPRNDNFRFNIPDEAARVWGDWGLPSSDSFNTCPLTPVPRGTTQSTGGFLRYSDCHTGWHVTGTVNSVTGLPGASDVIGFLGFSDAPRERPDESGTPLNQDNPYGDPHGEPVVTVWDCQSPPVVTIPSPNRDIKDLHVRSVSPGSPNAGGSIGGTVNETQEGFANCDRSDAHRAIDADAYDAVEDDHEGVTGPRARTDFYFDYREPSQDGCGAGFLLVGALVELGAFPKRPPTSCTPGGSELTGEGATFGYLFYYPNTWYGNPGYTSSRNPYVNKETLQPWGGTYATFYAYVTPSRFPGGLPPAGNGIYGSEHCSAGGTPTTGKWNCDRSVWWVNPVNGEDESDEDGDGQTWRAKVGDAYNLRDIDCWDHSLARGTPGLLSLLGETQCTRPTP